MPYGLVKKLAHRHEIYRTVIGGQLLPGPIGHSEQAQIPTELVFDFDNLDCPPRDDEVIY